MITLSREKQLKHHSDATDDIFVFIAKAKGIEIAIIIAVPKKMTSNPKVGSNHPAISGRLTEVIWLILIPVESVGVNSSGGEIRRT